GRSGRRLVLSGDHPGGGARLSRPRAGRARTRYAGPPREEQRRPGRRRLADQLVHGYRRTAPGRVRGGVRTVRAGTGRPSGRDRPETRLGRDLGTDPAALGERRSGSVATVLREHL